MHKLLLITTIMLISTGVAFAQTTVQIGMGTDIPPQNTLYSPVFRFSATSATAFATGNILFTQAELAAAGITDGAIITAVAFNKLNDATLTTPGTFSIYMGNSANTSLSVTGTRAGTLGGQSQVYTSNVFNVPAVAGWINWSVTPFLYTGASLEIATDLSIIGNGGATDYFQWEYTAATPATTIVGQTGQTTPPTTLSSSNANYKHRPNIRITFTPPSLPLRLINFHAIPSAQNVLLAWKLESSAVIKSCWVERSENATDFRPLSAPIIVTPTNINYTFIDSIVVVPVVYYRLRALNHSGSNEYSQVLSVKTSLKRESSFAAWPNPFANTLCLSTQILSAGTVRITVTDATSRQVLAPIIMSLLPGQSNESIPSIETLPKGLYNLNLLYNGYSKTIQVIKN
jgi:hypothetical protein